MHMAFLGQESQWAAEASECAADQNAFWPYHDKLFASQAGENQGAFNKDKLKAFAVELGLEPKAFNDCLDSGKYTQLVQSQTAAAGSFGVTGHAVVLRELTGRRCRRWRNSASSSTRPSKGSIRRHAAIPTPTPLPAGVPVLRSRSEPTRLDLRWQPDLGRCQGARS